MTNSAKNFIWENYRSDHNYYLAKLFSPYTEVQYPYNEQCAEYEVNIKLRDFTERLFSEILKKKNDGATLKEMDSFLFDSEFENLLLSISAVIDMHNATDKRFVYRGIIMRRLDSGKYGSEAACLYQKLSSQDRAFIADRLLERSLSGERDSRLEAVVYPLFSSENERCVLYYNKETDGFILWTEKQRTDELETTLQLIRILFLDMEKTIEPIWGNHFGIIGYDSTMTIGEAQII